LSFVLLSSYIHFFPFFFQAEDGIRDFHVTGVQTCALPISARLRLLGALDRRRDLTMDTEFNPETDKCPSCGEVMAKHCQDCWACPVKPIVHEDLCGFDDDVEPVW